MLTLIPLDEFQERLVHLAELAELLPEFAATPGGTWLYREILREIDELAVIAWDYWIEAVKTRKALEARHDLDPEPQANNAENGGDGA